jgi:hypothetical protein
VIAFHQAKNQQRAMYAHFVAMRGPESEQMPRAFSWSILTEPKKSNQNYGAMHVGQRFREKYVIS